MVEEQTCPDEYHEQFVKVPPFDEERARNMTSYEVCRAYPRYHWHCDRCSANGVVYASYEHYLYGDW